MIISKDLAQQIVDSIMPLVSYNVNIMDIDGIIIGSGQKDRLHSFHKGAKDALSQHKVIEIFTDNLADYPGALPGLNMPIELENQVIGVVGISGPPDAVRTLAGIVKAFTQLILERELLRENFHSHTHRKEQFVSLLLSGNAKQHTNELVIIAKLLSYQLQLARIVIVADLQSIIENPFHTHNLQDLAFARKQETLLQLIENSPEITTQDLVIISEQKLIVLKHFTSDSHNLQQDWVAAFSKLIQTAADTLPIQLGIGSLASDFSELANSYHEALWALHNCSKDQAVCFISQLDILSTYLIRQITDSRSCRPFEKLQIQLESQLSQKYDIYTTIRRLLKNNLNIVQTAQDLYIHRNTLLFRLQKLKEVTGLDPCHNINHAFLCQMLCKRD